MNTKKGFTLIEILLVVVIIGVMMAVIVPRAWRANVDAKYTLVRQVGSELAAYANDWAHQGLTAQAQTDTSTIVNYYASLVGQNSQPAGGNWRYGHWIGFPNRSVWNNQGLMWFTLNRAANVEATVQDLVPPEKTPLNPFNGSSYFFDTNYPTNDSPIPGALACAARVDGDGYLYVAMLYQGTDSVAGRTGRSFAGDGGSQVFHAGMDSGGAIQLGALRNGIFVAQVR